MRVIIITIRATSIDLDKWKKERVLSRCKDDGGNIGHNFGLRDSGLLQLSVDLLDTDKPVAR